LDGSSAASEVLTSREHPDTAIAATTETTFEEGQGSRRVLRGMPLTTRTIDDKGGSFSFIIIRATRWRWPGSELARWRGTRSARRKRRSLRGLTQARTTRTEYSYDDKGA